MHFVRVLRGNVSLGGGRSTVHFVCFTWQCKPWRGTIVHFVRVLRGNVSLGGHCAVCIVSEGAQNASECFRLHQNVSDCIRRL